MIRIFMVLILCLTVIPLNAQTNNCAKFKTGYFELIANGGANTYIKRTRHIQTEWDKMLGGKVKLKITWVDDCNYKLRLIGGNERGKKESQKYSKNTMDVRITETGDDFYKLSAKMEGVDMREYSCKVVKIKKW